MLKVSVHFKSCEESKKVWVKEDMVEFYKRGDQGWSFHVNGCFYVLK